MTGTTADAIVVLIDRLSRVSREEFNFTGRSVFWKSTCHWALAFGFAWTAEAAVAT